MKSAPLNYVQIACTCPRGHLLGTVVQTPTGLWWGGRVLRDGRPVQTTSLPRGHKVKASCAACGLGTDYQASWKRVAAALAEARDTHSARTTLVFG